MPGSSTWRASGGCRITIPISGKPSASGTSAKAPYLTLPIFGPSDARDAVGLLVGFAANPLTWMSGTPAMVAGFGRAGTQGIDERGRNIDTLDDLQRSSLDFYATLRSVYRQHREGMIEEAKSGNPNAHVEFGYPKSDEGK